MYGRATSANNKFANDKKNLVWYVEGQQMGG